MYMRRKLPLLTERTLADVRIRRTELATEFGHITRSRGTVMCKAGCSDCCRHPVVISALEGALLYQWLANRGKWTPTFKRKVQDTAELTSDVAMEVWLLANIPCPLLGQDNLCAAYEARPFNCRTTLSVGDPYYCHPHRIADGSAIVSRVSVLQQFHEEEQKLLKRYGLKHFLMPISKALLVGERIITGNLDLENVDRVLLEEYAETHG